MTDWRENVIAKVGERVAKDRASGPRGLPWMGMHLRLHPELHAHVRAAAHAHDLSVQTYLRRLLALAVAKELGVTARHLLPLLPQPTAWGGGRENLTDRDTSRRDDGSGWEGLCTHPGCFQSHT